MGNGLKLALGFLLLFWLGACSVETQKGRESFDAQKLPVELAKLANQTLELRAFQDQILKRVAADQTHFTLPVAVIDNGVDLAHPDLVDKYDFKIQNGQIVGAGHDFMGDDDFSSSVLINPELFALTATQIKGGLIVLGNQNPFEKMIALDQKISQVFLAKLKADPILSKTLFAKLSKDSFNAFGLYRLINDEKENALFDPGFYQMTKAEGKLLGPDFRQKARANEVLARAWSLENVYYFVDYPVQYLDPATGLSYMFGFLNQIEGADRFVELLKETWGHSAEAAELQRAVGQVVQFRLQRDHTPAPQQNKVTESVAQFLSQALEYHKGGISIRDPILDLRWATVTVATSGLEMGRAPTDFPTVQITSDFVASQLNISNQRIDKYRQLMDQVPLSTQEKFKLRAFDRALKKNTAMTQAYLQERTDDLSRIYDSDYHSRLTSELRKYHFRNKHPYLSQLSENEVHGTHVSGIIAKQNEDIRIYPVRVTTRSATLTNTEYKKMIQDYKTEFQTWLQKPLVMKAIFSNFSKVFPIGMAEPSTDDQRKQAVDSLMVQINEAIEMSFESGTMDFIFFQELKQALKHVGEKKIKIANISLGAEQKNPIPKLSDIDPEKDLPSVFAFLNFEFLKFQIGEILSTTSKDTLFVVAAGNSSTWVDGKSHSAVPVDVTSRFLAMFEDGDMVAPNNHLTNVLAVGSLSQDEDLSDFTNVILGMKTPMIFAIGEKILSPVKTTELSPAKTVIDSYVPTLSSAMPVATSDDRVTGRYLLENPNLKPDSENKGKAAAYLRAGLSLVDRVNEVYKTELAIRYNDHREYLSGTSMATPAIAGVIADQILKRAQSLGLASDQVYDHPEMTPANLIQELQKTGKPLFPENPQAPFRKIDVRGKYDRGEKMQKLEEKLKLILLKAS